MKILKHLTKFCLVISVVLLVFSCDSEPEKETVPVPTGIRVSTNSFSTKTLRITWNDVSDRYVVEESDSNNYGWNSPAQVNRNNITYSDGSSGDSYYSFRRNSTVYFRVRSVSSKGNLSDWSNPLAVTITDGSSEGGGGTAPSAPTGVTATATSSSSISISWNTVTETTGYYIYRSSSASGTYSQVGTSTSSTYSNTGLSANTIYYYKVAAYNSNGTSSQSSYVSATTQASGGGGGMVGEAPLTAPSGLKVTSQTSSSVVLSWNALNGASNYEIFSSTSSSGTYSSRGFTSGGATTFTVTGLSSSTTYYFKVAGVNTKGSGDKSVAVSATTSGSGTGSVRVVNSSKYANDPILVQLSRNSDDFIIGERTINNNSEYTFTNVPSGVQFKVWGIDNLGGIYSSTAFTLTSGQTRVITFNGDSLSP